MTNIDLCNEILANIKHSLNHCCSNKQIHSFTFSKNENNQPLDKMVPFIFPSKCPNITLFQKQQLVATKTKIIYNIPIIDVYKQYSIEYDVNNRQIIIDQ